MGKWQATQQGLMMGYRVVGTVDSSRETAERSRPVYACWQWYVLASVGTRLLNFEEKAGVPCRMLAKSVRMINVDYYLIEGLSHNNGLYRHILEKIGSVCQ